jgi:hypothetical protein
MKTPQNRAPEIPALGSLMLDASNAMGKKAKLNRGPRARGATDAEDQVVRGFVLAPTARGPPDVELGAMTIAEFCKRYHINRVTLYKMRRDGTGPEVLSIGCKVLITYRAAHEWEARMSSLSVPRARTA